MSRAEGCRCAETCTRRWKVLAEKEGAPFLRAPQEDETGHCLSLCKGAAWQSKAQANPCQLTLALPFSSLSLLILSCFDSIIKLEGHWSVLKNR
eukprot:888104-Pelagomonas_calceolata.AAC.1